MKDLKNIPLFLIPYLTFCSALYHLTYWETFNINGLAFLSISDIIKSSVYPVLTILIAVVYNLAIQNLILPSNADGQTTINPKKGISNMILLLCYFFAISAVAIIMYLTKNKSPDRLIGFALFHAIFPAVFLTNNGFLKGQFTSERVRRLVIDLIVFIPVAAYFTGKYKSELVSQNLQYKFSVITHPENPFNCASNDTLKFVGNTEKHFVFTDLNNTKVLFVKSDKIDTLILYDKE